MTSIFQALPPFEVKKIEEKHQKKLDFYKRQEEIDWKNWLVKTPEIIRFIRGSKQGMNFKNTQHRAKRRIEKQAKKLIVYGSVIILVNEPVPPGAVYLQERCTSRSCVPPGAVYLQERCTSRSGVPPGAVYLQEQCASLVKA